MVSAIEPPLECLAATILHPRRSIFGSGFSFFGQVQLFWYYKFFSATEETFSSILRERMRVVTIRNLVNKWLEEGKAAIEIHRKLTLLAEGKPEFTRCIIPGTGLAISARAQDTANQASLIRVIASNDDETVDLIRATTTGWPERSFLINTLGNTPDHKALLVRMVKDPLYMDYEDG